MTGFLFGISLLVVVAMIAFSRSARTLVIMCGAYMASLTAAILYDTGWRWWWTLMVIFAILSVVSVISIQMDRERREFQEWLDGLD
jgi:CHASE2 domain-containing sensor protein